MNGDAAPGWHGKLPTLGDFASRRLDAGFVEPWDAWLSAGLLALRQARPEQWLPAYLGSPSWRFLLLPGALPGAAGAQAWCGVLMPSVDRVGRYFPLTLAQPLGPDLPAASALWPWLARLDDLARDALYQDWTAEQLESELAGLPRLPAAGTGSTEAGPGADGVVELGALAAADPALHLAHEARRAWARQRPGGGWWHARPDDAPPRLLCSQGLPPTLVGRLLGGAATMPT